MNNSNCNSNTTHQVLLCTWATLSASSPQPAGSDAILISRLRMSAKSWEKSHDSPQITSLPGRRLDLHPLWFQSLCWHTWATLAVQYTGLLIGAEGRQQAPGATLFPTPWPWLPELGVRSGCRKGWISGSRCGGKGAHRMDTGSQDWGRRL